MCSATTTQAGALTAPAVLAVGPLWIPSRTPLRGEDVQAAGSVAEALLYFGEVRTILLDADGLDPWRAAVTAFLRRWPDCRIVLVSRLADEQLWIEALDAGVYDLLPYPFLPLEMDCVLGGAAPEGRS